MKKLLFVVLGVMLFAPAAFADNWGLGLKLGAGENDPKTIKDIYNSATVSKELDEGNGIFGLEALYEWNLNDINKIGGKIGVDIYGENKAKFTGFGEITEDTYAFPFTVYFKQDYGVKKWSWFAGAGLTILRTEVEGSVVGIYTGSETKTKVFPHIVAGAEYRFSELFALGLEARYNISAKLKKDGAVYSDRSGFGAALTGRFYF